ncbi:hypothetical protein GE061_012291 [Apolygus lucorum]|uniref:Uncharacterized protein n=1 Tax=Apolygus lucorum TaxID=248454 RepID=A0A6A4JSQ9_APOLU|nr:hypothetical protein GE061_012291 [Apolygus lucorum]
MDFLWVCLVLFARPSGSLEVPFSPCPRFFEYFHSVVWMGRVSVPVPRTGLPVFTQVFLSLKTALRSKYVGLIELSDPVEIAVDDIVNLRADFINYTVRFPLPYPLPTLTEIRVNNVSLCCSPAREFGLVTAILLEHTFPTNSRYLLGAPVVNVAEPIPYEVCGHRKPTDSLDVRGFGEWPWLAAILLENDRGLEFHCSGNLLTEKHVITAAHCVKTRFGHQYSPRHFAVYFGKYDLTRWGEEDSQVRNVENVIIHPDYLRKIFSSDLAVFVLEEAVELNDFVRPVCVWREGPELLPLVGTVGAVVGWGKHPSRRMFNAAPRMFHLPIVDQEQCLRSRRDYFYVTSGKTFCAGLRNGTGPCNGDSGSGMVLPRTYGDNQTVWFLRGVISLSLLDPYKQTCDLSNYLVFTDVAKFTEWISETIENTF